MMPTKRKAFAYITQGNDLLVFEHEGAPEAGIQVPAGSIEAGESPEEAALREAKEETGLQKLSIVRFLGEQIRDMSDYGKQEIHHRYFYHLKCDEDMQPSWQHGEKYPSDELEHDGSFRHIFNFYRANLGQLPELIADHDFYVVKLIAGLRADKHDAQQE